MGRVVIRTTDRFLFVLALILWFYQFFADSVSAAVFCYALFVFLFWRQTFSAGMAFVSSATIIGFFSFEALKAQLPFFGSWMIPFVGGFVTALYFGIHALLFLDLVRNVARGVRLLIPFAIVLSASVAVWTFWLTRLCLWPLGIVEGVYVLHPLVALITLAPVRFVIFWCGDLLAVFLLTLFLVLLFEFLAQHYWIRLSFLLFCFWSISLFVPPHQPPAWLSCIGVGSPSFCPFPTKSSYEFVEDISTWISAEIPEEKLLVVLPETMMPYCCSGEFILSSLGQLSSDNRMIVLGAYRREFENEVTNSALVFWRGELIFTYDKSHRVPFAERFPLWVVRLLSYFGCAVTNFGLGSGDLSRFATPLGIECLPIMCSELFFTQRLRKMHFLCDDLVCALVNDGWFISSPLATILFKTALFQAVWAHVPLLYISYTRQYYISSWGSATAL